MIGFPLGIAQQIQWVQQDSTKQTQPQLQKMETVWGR